MRKLTIWQAAAYAMELGAAFATAVVVGLIVGQWVDVRQGNGFPIWTLVGSFVGFASGVYSVARIAKYLTRSESRPQ